MPGRRKANFRKYFKEVLKLLQYEIHGSMAFKYDVIYPLLFAHLIVGSGLFLGYNGPPKIIQNIEHKLNIPQPDNNNHKNPQTLDEKLNPPVNPEQLKETPPSKYGPEWQDYIRKNQYTQFA